MSNNLKKRC